MTSSSRPAVSYLSGICRAIAVYKICQCVLMTATDWREKGKEFGSGIAAFEKIRDHATTACTTGRRLRKTQHV